MPSIRQNPWPDALPDFRNLGVLARALVAVNLLALGAAFVAESDAGKALDAFVLDTTLVEPPLLGTLAILYAAAPATRRLPLAAGCALALAVALALTAATQAVLGELVPADPERALAFAACACALVLGYLTLHWRAHSPALAEARLQALQARIRPHFLFNSLNAVLGLIRSDPQRAERTLEDLADLFRSLLADDRRLVRLADELALLERYAAIEQLRMGDRLRLAWDIDAAPSDALLPSLLLQPLLENAIHHGVEPGVGIGDVLVRVGRRGDRVQVRIENPLPATPGADRPGNHMALDNIRERLMLFFDAEARLEAGEQGGRYVVDIDLPYRERA